MTNQHRAFYVDPSSKHRSPQLKPGDAFGNGWVFDSVTDDGECIVTRSAEHGTTMNHRAPNVGCEIHKFVGTVDITPTWRAVLPVLIEVASNADTGKARMAARVELNRMADLADKYVELMKAQAPVVASEGTPK